MISVEEGSSVHADTSSAVKVKTLRAPEHLNNTGCHIKYVEGKGRGVFAVHDIPAQTLVEISPALLFERDEYQNHGRHTMHDHCTFVWRDGRVALALGLGSLFNHSRSPNVSYTLDHDTESIRYTTSRAITKDEELCIFYGHKLWFEDADGESKDFIGADGQADPFNGFSRMDDDDKVPTRPPVSRKPSVLAGDPDEIVPEARLPFARVKLVDDEEEDEIENVRLEKVWVVDIPDPRQTTTLLKWLQRSGLDDPPLSHLKRIRRSRSPTPSTSTLLLAPLSAWPTPPELPADLNLPEPYAIDIPKGAALTQKALKAKSTFWPTIYAPRKKFEPEPWTRGRVRWAYEALKALVKEAEVAKEKGELPIVAYVPVPFDEATREATQVYEPFITYDTRQSSQHPLRHAALNVIRRIADHRASPNTSAPASSIIALETLLMPTPSIEIPAAGSALSKKTDSESQNNAEHNGLHYLLTGLTLFISHEPCVMCSMALLHSRVKEIFYLLPMEKTGGCGGVACIPKLPGVNHRYGISRWNVEEGGIISENIRLGPEIDA